MRQRQPRPIDNPESHNKTTRLCGISATYKINKKLGRKAYRCLSILIGPGRVVSRNYDDANYRKKLKEAIAIRKAAIKLWPHFDSIDARNVSTLCRNTLDCCPKCSSEVIFETEIGDGYPGTKWNCSMCGWVKYSQLPGQARGAR